MKYPSKKIVLLTGSSRGLGFSLAKKLIDANYVVNACVRDMNSENLLKIACHHSPNLLSRKMDLSSYANIEQVVNDVMNDCGRIDILIHNAAIGLLGPTDSATIDEIEYLFKINVFSILKLTQLVIPSMQKNNSGHIIAISSSSGIVSSPFIGLYAATKHALEAIARSWAITLNPWHIKVSIIQPGSINTNFIKETKIGTHYQKNSRKNPYKKFIDNAINFLTHCLKNGDDPERIAQNILDIINKPITDPVLCHQLGDYAKKVAQTHYYDPSGQKWIQEQCDLVNDWFK